MVKKNRAIIGSLGVIIIIIACLGYNFINTKKSEELIISDDINSMVDAIILNDIKGIDDELINVIRTKISNMELNILDRQELVKLKFIEGYLYLLNGDNESSISAFKEVIKNSNKDTDAKIRVWATYKLSMAQLYEEQYYDSETTFNKAVEICESEYNQKTLVDMYRVRAMSIIDTPEGIPKSIELIDKAVDIANKINYDKARVYSSTGTAYEVAGQLIQSIEYQLDAIEYCKKEGLKNLEMINEVDIAVNYLDLGNYDEAIKYLVDILKETTEEVEPDAHFKSYALVNLCDAYIKTNNIEGAEDSISQLEKIVKDLKGEEREDTKTFIYALKANIAFKSNQHEEAINLIKLAEERYEERIGDFTYFDFDILIQETYGDIYYSNSEYDKALEYHKNAENLAIERGSKCYKEKHSEKLYLDYLALGDSENAFKYMGKNIAILKEIKSSSDLQHAQFLHKQFESEKNKQKIISLEDSKRLMIIILTITIIIAIMLGIGSVYIYKKNKEVNKLNKLFKSLSVTDSLTGIPNRRALDEYLAGNWALYRKTQMPISFVMIDIDCFKNYNDNYGHPQGDIVLEKVSNGIKSSCRNSDFLARYGGEEFTIIMLDTDKDEALMVVERIKENIYNLNINHEFSEVSDRVTISMGLSTAYVGTNKDYDTYIKKADKALYEAKNKGRDMYLHLK